jgi:hypothetical protein
MWPYWLLFLVPLGLLASRARPATLSHTRVSLSWRIVFLLLVMAIGLRHEVGADWFTYAEQIVRAREMSASDLLAGRGSGDPAYDLLNWIAAEFDLGPYFVNSICASVFSWGLLVFCRAQPRPWLALVVAVPYLVTVVAMGYTRQSVAIGLAMLALVALSEQRLVRFVMFLVAAAAFHKSAVILMPLAALAATRNRIWTVTWVGLSTLLFYGLFLEDSVANLRAGYLEAQYESSGAAVRVAMNALPALLFILFRRRFVLSSADRSFWTWMALGGIAFAPLLALSPSSTAVDRVALYWIPLQLFVLSRLPNAIGPPNGRNLVWVGIIVFYSAAVLFVWLSFAATAFAWLPYQFYPWVLLSR